MKSPKTFLLDTNVLLHDPRSLFNFQEHHIVLPVEVLEELDRFKGEQNERGHNSRQVHRELKRLFANAAAMARGVSLPSGGRLSVLFNPYLLKEPAQSKRWKQFRIQFPDLAKADTRILAAVVHLADTVKGKVVLVTKDINMHLKALALGLLADDYLTDKVKENVASDTASHAEVLADPHELQRYASEGHLQLEGGRSAQLELNEYVLLRTAEGHTMPGRHHGGGRIHRLNCPPAIRALGGATLKPRNLEQQFLFDALLDPSLSLVTCYGKAGTGKTIVSIACGLHEIAQQHYDGLSVTRPVMPLGRDIGFLPGDLQEKMNPWLQPYYDALTVLFPARPPVEPQFADKRRSQRHGDHPYSGLDPQAAHPAGNAKPAAKPYQRLIEAGVIEIEALTFIRGRSIPRRFFILDEAQQLTPHEVKTVISRMSEGSKLVLIGDPTQIDNPYVDSQSNGLVYAKNKMSNQRLAAHIKLVKGERSELADLAVRLL